MYVFTLKWVYFVPTCNMGWKAIMGIVAIKSNLSKHILSVSNESCSLSCVLFLVMDKIKV